MDAFAVLKIQRLNQEKLRLDSLPKQDTGLSRKDKDQLNRSFGFPHPPVDVHASRKLQIFVLVTCSEKWVCVCLVGLGEGTGRRVVNYWLGDYSLSLGPEETKLVLVLQGFRSRRHVDEEFSASGRTRE